MDNDTGKKIANTSFLGEPAWRWAAFAISASLFLFVWGRVITMLAEGVAE